LRLDRRSGPDRRVRNEPWRGPDRRSGLDRRDLPVNDDARVDARVTLSSDTQGAGGEGERRRGALAVPSTRHVIDTVGTVLTDLVSGFYDANISLRSWADVLDKVRMAVQADFCAIATHDFADGRGRFEESVGFDPTYLTAYADLYSADNPWLQHRERFAEAGTLWTSQDLMADKDLIETDFYRYWLRPQNAFHHLFGVIDASETQVTYIVLGRSYPKGAFWLDHAALLRRMLPTIAQAMRAGRHYQRECRLQKLAFDALDVMPIGFVLLNRRGGGVAINRFARDIIEGEDVIFVGSGGLGLKLPAGRVRLRDYLSSRPGSSRDAVGDVLSLSVPRGPERRPLTIVATSLPASGGPISDDDPVAAVFIGDPERPVQVDPRLLIRLYGLSRAESRVAALLASGLRLDKVAEALGLTYETVRKHLKQIFTKTTTERQAELVRTLNLGPAGLNLDGHGSPPPR
jgi:DNA-binding CsgD family transcriptional regulator